MATNSAMSTTIMKQIKDINKISNQQKIQIGSILNNSDRYEEGIIRATSQQGNKLYCIVQKKPKLDDNGKEIPQGVGEKYFGNSDRAAYDDFTLAEALIETDVELSTVTYNPDDWIGKYVVVWIVATEPRLVMMGYNASPPRVVSDKEIKAARALNKDEGLKSREAKDFLQSLGYSDKQIGAIVGETLTTTKPLGTNISYGTSAIWGEKTPDPGYTNLSDSLEAGIVTNLSGHSLRNEHCHKPLRTFTAR